jgi:serine phosphatase RsbU (regulator of sigma subunit)
MENAQYETETLPFNKNDCLLLYTDGLIDAVNFEGKMWARTPAECAGFV